MARINELLDKLETLAKKATPGPWKVGSVGGQCHKKHQHGQDCEYEPYWNTPEPERVENDLDYSWNHAIWCDVPYSYASGHLEPDGLIAGTWDYECGGIKRQADVDFLAMLDPQTVLSLCAEVRRLQKQIDCGGKSSTSCLSQDEAEGPCKRHLVISAIAKAQP